MIKIIILVFLFAGNLWSLTLKEITKQSRNRIGDTFDKKFYLDYTDAELHKKINVIKDEIISFSRGIEGRWTSSTTVNKREYPISTTTLVITRVCYSVISSTNVDSGEYKRLTPITLGGLDKKVSSLWETTAAGLPTRYYKRAGMLGLHPKPSAAYASTHTVLRVDIIKRPAPLVNDADIPFDDLKYLYPYHYLIVKGVTAMCNRIGWDTYYMLLEKMRKDLAYQPDVYIGEPYIRERRSR